MSFFNQMTRYLDRNRVLRAERNELRAQLHAVQSKLGILNSGANLGVLDVDSTARIKALHNELARLESSSDAQQRYEQLQGTPHSRYLLPIDYLPSRSFKPRWGYSHPREPILDQWFRSNLAAYDEFLEYMKTSIPWMEEIPLRFDEANLPQPAWADVPYAAFDSVALYSMVRKYKPKRYLEIGSGITTCFAHKAVKDHGLETRILSIDPDPRTKIDLICDAVIRDGLETCNLSIFDELEPSDILFFDGSHRSFMNSDVTVFMIDVLPRIKPGVIIHVHDINLPFDYPDSFKTWYWNEQYMLAVYLMANRHRIDPLFPTTFVCQEESLNKHFRSPMLDLGVFNDAWRGGGAMWFTHLT